ncbi:MAG: glycosyltransferase family 4 protein [Bacteroidetes bacterium]|nr:glycosyltransferase family 4 protein [Bacteroidota bacterium]
MKILQIATKVPYPLKDGSKIGIFNLTKQYLKQGAEVHFAAPVNGEKVDSEFTSMVTFIPLPEIQGYTISGGIKNLFSPYPYNLERYFDRSGLERLLEVYANDSFDIVHVDHLHMARYGLALKEKFGARVALREHNFESEIMGRVSMHVGNPLVRFYAGIQHSKMLKLESDVLGKVDIVLPISKVDEEKMMKLVPGLRSFVVPAGVDFEKYVPSGSPAPDRVLLLSSYDWLPNTDSFRFYMKNILPKLREKAPNIRTIVAGKATERLRRAETGEGCDIVGYVDDFNKFGAMASVAVIPLRIGSGIRIKLLELMALGMAIVSTSVGAEGIDVQDGKHLLLADSPEEFADKIVLLNSSPDLRRDLGENARKLVSEKYTWDSVGRKLIEACKSVL